MPIDTSSLSEAMLLQATEAELSAARSALLETQSYLKSLDALAELRAALTAHKISVDTTFVLHEVVDQNELIYVVISEKSTLYSIEMLASGPPRVQTMEMEPYKKGLSRTSRIRLQVARELLTGPVQ